MLIKEWQQLSASFCLMKATYIIASPRSICVTVEASLLSSEEKMQKRSSPKGDRTLDLKINSLALYLLSYQRFLAIEMIANSLLVEWR